MHQAKTTDRGIKSIRRLREILCGAFEGFDIGETSARGRFPNVGQHGRRYVGGHHPALGADSLRRLESLATSATGEIQDPHAGTNASRVQHRLGYIGQPCCEHAFPLGPARRSGLPCPPQFSSDVVTHPRPRRRRSLPRRSKLSWPPACATHFRSWATQPAGASCHRAFRANRRKRSRQRLRLSETPSAWPTRQPAASS